MKYYHFIKNLNPICIMLIKEYEYCINYQYIIQCFTDISFPLENNKRSDKIPQVRKIQGM